jgi:hypothetical protein
MNSAFQVAVTASPVAQRTANVMWMTARVAFMLVLALVVDPLRCPSCGAEMRIVAFITQRAVIDRILAHVRRARESARGPPRATRRAPARPQRQPA